MTIHIFQSQIVLVDKVQGVKMRPWPSAKLYLACTMRPCQAMPSHAEPCQAGQVCKSWQSCQTCQACHDRPAMPCHVCHVMPVNHACHVSQSCLACKPCHAFRYCQVCQPCKDWKPCHACQPAEENDSLFARDPDLVVLCEKEGKK